MKRMWMPKMRGGLAAWVLVGAFVALAASAAWAGIEPSPWRLRTAALNVVAQGLGAVDGRLQAVLAAPPVDGTVARLAVIALELRVQEGIVQAVLAVPPDGNAPPEFFTALGNVRAAAAGIADQAGRGWGTPPTDGRVLDALARVQGGAQDIVNTVDAYLALKH